MKSRDFKPRCYQSVSLLAPLLWLLLVGSEFPPHATAQQLVGSLIVPPAPCAGHDKPAILYTGKTYGYLRDNDHEPDSAAYAFGRTYKNVHDACPQAILVGMGDNLAPEYGARTYLKENKKTGALELSYVSRLNPHPSTTNDLGPWPSGGPWLDWIEENQAVLFFKYHQYKALVPGQMDFYFGADFLRHAGAISELPMLGANLMITSTKQAPSPQPLCGQPQLLLPTQVSLPLQSGSGSSGGGKGKSGGKKGGGGSGQNSGSTSGQSTSGQSGQLCLQATSPRASGARGELALTTPPSDSVYPWSAEFEFSVSDETVAALFGLKPPYPRDVVALKVKTGLIFGLCPWTRSGSKPEWAQCTMLDAPVPSGNSNDPAAPIYASEISNPNQIPIEKDTGKLKLKTDTPDNPSGIVLYPGATVELCVGLAAATPADHKPAAPSMCTDPPLHVQTPFFQRAWVQEPGVQEPGKVTTQIGVHYVIFGVLDPAIQGMISPENSSWGTDDKYTSQITIVDPAPALEQLVTTFQQLHKNDSTTWTYVLLAQMQRAPAQALASALQWRQEHLPNYLPASHHQYHFDLILSAATYDDATPDLELTIDQWRWPIPLMSPQPIKPTPVITPHPIVTGPKMTNPLALLVVDRPNLTQAKYTNYTVSNSHHVVREDDKDPVTDTFSQACKTYEYIDQTLNAFSLARLENATGRVCNAGSAFKCLALQSMRDELSTDAAFLQVNDFYDQCNYKGPTVGSDLGQMVDRVLWNSGYLTRVSVSGATLKTILQNSDKIAKQEQSSTNEPAVRNQNLVTLGITKFNEKYYIDGAEVEESKIYAIATSDQLAFETTAYPQFAQVDLVSPTVFTGWKKQTFAIAQLASTRLAGSNSSCPLSRSDLVAVGPRVGDAPSAPKEPKSLAGPFDNVGGVDKAVQNRKLLTVTLQQASVGYTNSKPSQTDANINTNLAGVTNPNVAAPHSDSLSYSDSFRLLYQWTRYWNFGFDQTITFARSRTGSLTAPAQKTTTGQAIPPESINLSANTLIVSPFIEFQLHRYQGHFKAVARPVTFSTGLSRTLQFLTTKTPQVEYELNLKRQENWQPSVGIRYEWDNLNFFETGYLSQSARNVLAALTVNGKTTPLTAGTTVSQVTNVVPNPGDVAIPIYATFHQQGAYWLGMYTKNLTRNAKTVKVTYQGITYGNFLAYGAAERTSTALTRYAAELSNSMQVQLWGNITFGPSYNIFWFQDQSHAIGNSLTRRDWNLQLNYSFDWHQGLEWKDVLEGKTGQ